MQVEGAEARHAPDHFGQHAEGDDYLYVRLPCAQGLEECFVFQLFRLEQGEVVLQCILFHGGVLDLMPPSGGFVGHGDDAHYVISALYQATKGFDGKVGSSHIYYSQIFFSHHVVYDLNVLGLLKNSRCPVFCMSLVF